MLKPANRLKARGEFKRTLAARRLCTNDHFVLCGILADAPGLQPRIGFVVSKKVHKRSVRRNRIKRRLRELVRLLLLSDDRPRLSRYRSLVIIARAGSADAPFQDLRHKMNHCLTRL